MKQTIIIVKSVNLTPESEVNERIEELGDGWEIVSASTALAPHGQHPDQFQASSAAHVYYITTIVLKKVS